MTHERTGAEYVYEALVEAGFDHLIGLPGTQTLPLDRIVSKRDEMEYVMARHETAIPHIAWGYYEASGHPAATLTVPGPGDTNAMHGLKNAADDGVPIVHLSADVNPADRGKGPIHEIDPRTFDSVVKANVNTSRARDLREDVARGIQIALAEPSGPVRLGIPSGILEAEFEAQPVSYAPDRVTHETDQVCSAAIEALAGAERPVVYVGGGARRSAAGTRVVRELVEVLSAPVLSTYKGKGVFPEDDDRFLGISSSVLPAGAWQVLEQADVVLALGTDFDGPTTAGWQLPLGGSLIHVTLDREAVDVAYEADVAIIEDVAVAGDRLLAGLEGHRPIGWDGATIGAAVQEEYRRVLSRRGLLAGGSPATSPELLFELREAAPRETIVTVDIGGFRLWALETFEAYAPQHFVAAGSWAGMGVGLPAAIGAAIARPEHPVLCLTGDGGLMMCIHELHTAAEYDLDVTVVISNNADYAVISQSSKLATDREFAWDSPDFVTIAEGFGCRATTAETAEAAAEAVKEAIGRSGPDVVNVHIDPEEPSPVAVADYDSSVELPE